MSKEEAYAACDQKSEVLALEAEKIEEMKQSVESKKSSGGFVGGFAAGLSSWGAKNKAKDAALKSCLIDYGYLMR